MSIKEQRRIIFGLPALREAVQAHMPDIAPALVPRGAQVKGIALSADPLAARIRVLAQGAHEPCEAELSAAHLGAVLIRRCKVLNIPLPRNAKKALEGDANGIAMIVTLTHEAQSISHLSAHRVGA
ncbi:hypothetical protein [Elioraea rosea]|uniref:hypothetical protein n=1 Tax=Elioraea rosea TaxID=2492390 RepID=UPI0011836F7A|nr:hypothetical protein [Elioraea rosea]